MVWHFQFYAAASYLSRQSARKLAPGSCFYCQLSQKTICLDFQAEEAAQHRFRSRSAKVESPVLGHLFADVGSSPHAG